MFSLSSMNVYIPAHQVTLDLLCAGSAHYYERRDEASGLRRRWLLHHSLTVCSVRLRVASSNVKARESTELVMENIINWESLLVD